MNNKISLGVDRLVNNKKISNSKKIVLLENLKKKIILIDNNKKSNNELGNMVYDFEKSNHNKQRNKTNENAKVLLKKNGYAGPLIFTLLMSILFCLSIMIGYVLSKIN